MLKNAQKLLFIVSGECAKLHLASTQAYYLIETKIYFT